MEYRVIDLRPGTSKTEPSAITGARSPEAAARMALGMELTRSGRKRDLAARVYFQAPDQPITMVRLYTRSAHSSATP